MRFARARKLLCRTQSSIYYLREALKFSLLRALRGFIHAYPVDADTHQDQCFVMSRG